MRADDLSKRMRWGRRRLRGVAWAGLILWVSTMVPSTSLWAEPTEGEKMQAFEMSELIARRRQAGESWIEFLRVPALSMGLYVLAAGSEDPQTPHAEDEVYYVVSGRGVLRVEGKDRPVREGSVLFVEGKARHSFHSITEELTVMVFFAPAENPDAAPAADAR
jgi:mannose-6-phosphate isomerase-like protein (cupin superfamily)